MDKVIIHGVNVSECKYYCAKNDTGDAFDLTCTKENMPVFRCDRESMKNCYYKQLQRARAEIEQLKSDIESRTMCITCERELQNCNLQAENERLKEQAIRLTEENGNLIIRANTSYNNYRDTQRRLDELCKANIHNLALLSKANKTLQEIKKIAEDRTKTEDYLLCQEYTDLVDKILDFITKAESEG